MSEGSLLVTTVGAAPGSCAVPVLLLIRQLASRNPTLQGLECKVGVEEGLFLCDCPGSSYSLKYEVLGNIIKVNIGKDLPAERRRNAAYSILAMIQRGRNWTDAADVVHQEAYGASPVPGSGKNQRDRRRARRARRRPRL